MKQQVRDTFVDTPILGGIHRIHVSNKIKLVHCLGFRIDLDLTPVPFTTELVIAPMKAVVGLELNILKILI